MTGQLHVAAARSFPADRTAPRAVAKWLRESAVQSGLPPGRLDDAELCLGELVTNIVLHSRNAGYLGSPPTMTVSVRQEDCASLIVLEDYAGAFDPRSVPPPPVPVRLDEAVEGGRGIAIVRAFADELRYDRDSGHNRVTLVFRT